MAKTDIEKLKDRMWITGRCHMKAEKRKRFLELYFHITLALFALASIAISLFQDPIDASRFGSVATFTTICTLSISLLIFGFKFGETAAQHRSCYLDIQKMRLIDNKEAPELNIQYIETLGYYQNHSLSDYMAVTISNVFVSQQNLQDANGSPIVFPAFSRATYSIQWIIIRALALAFLLTPIALTLFATDAFGINNYWHGPGE
jgi:hypothetical protein